MALLYVKTHLWTCACVAKPVSTAGNDFVTTVSLSQGILRFISILHSYSVFFNSGKISSSLLQSICYWIKQSFSCIYIFVKKTHSKRSPTSCDLNWTCFTCILWCFIIMQCWIFICCKCCCLTFCKCLSFCKYVPCCCMWRMKRPCQCILFYKLLVTLMKNPNFMKLGCFS